MRAIFLWMVMGVVVWTGGALVVRGQEGGTGVGGGRVVVPLDDGWRFSGRVDRAFAAEGEGVEDVGGAWRVVDLPHDWSIEEPLAMGNRSGPAGAYLPGGVGWYRKHFGVPGGAAAAGRGPAMGMAGGVVAAGASGVDVGKRVFIEFDGVMQNSTVWINGQEAGRRPNGYVTFRYDVTNKLHAEAGGGAGTGAGENVVAVRVDNSVEPAARWYAGSGIERHVRLIAMNAVHVGQWETFVTTPRVSAEAASVHVATKVVNESAAAARVRVEVELFRPDGKSAGVMDAGEGREIAAGTAGDFVAELEVVRPALWGMETPAMYRAAVRVREAVAGDGIAAAGGGVIDEEATAFGIRSAEFRAETGFWLNGKNVKLYGVCLHADGGGFGAAVPMGIWERRLTLLRGLGVNAIRTSHNAPDPAFLDLCDRMGFVVMHEMFDTWTAAKVPGDYARFFNEWWERDLTDVVKRDRNHPSIVIYSAGNEIHDSQAKQKEILAQMLKVYHGLDATRPVTQALFRPENAGGAYSNGIAEMLDVVGTNYRPDQLVLLQQRNPRMKIIGTEDNYRAVELEVLRESPALAGEFFWTGVDYLGEGMLPPSIAQGFGFMDRTNAMRARGYEHAAWWLPAVGTEGAAGRPMVKIARATGPSMAGRRDAGGGRELDWTPANEGPHEETVEVYSNCETVELRLNGQSLGLKPMPRDVTRTWRVAYAAGTLVAVARNAGVQVARDALRTAGKAVGVRLTADSARLSPAWDDVSYVRAELVDAEGVVNPNAAGKVMFQVEGPGVIAAVDNADLDSHESFRGNQRSTYRGTCIAVIKATAETGKITVTAEAEGLAPATAVIEAVPASK